MARRGIVPVLLLCLAPGLAQAQRPDTLPYERVPVPAGFRLTQPAALRAPWLGAPPEAPARRLDSALVAVLDSARAAGALARRTALIYGARVEQREEEAPARQGVLGVPEKYADLTIDGQARVDIRTERVRNDRCTPAEVLDPTSGCSGGIKAPKLENHVNVRSAGLIGQRVHLNVDFDSDRDFSANNNIQVYYQGLEDEVVRRIEVGSVSFRPPPSRFLTAAVPSNNFGVNGQFEVGPMQFQTLFATQKGSALSTHTYVVGGGSTSQPQDQQLRDLDFESGRFFWVVDPTLFPQYPALDILNLDPAQLPASDRPQQVRVYRYRAALAGSGANLNLGGIRAFAVSFADTTQRFGTPQNDEGAQWELLVQGRDYYLDPSGLWFALSTKLAPSDYLAVSYVAQDGSRVGTFPSVDRPTAVDTLDLIVQPNRGPGAGTFRFEMRQVYRIAGSDLDRSSLTVSLALNRSERPASGQPTYLAQLGLAVPTDPTAFDVANRLFPRTRDPGGSDILRDSYIVFPNLQPFADASRLAPSERSDSLYRTPLFLLFSEGPPSRFQFALHYNASSGSDRSVLSLNAIQIRDGSEQLAIGGRTLVRNVDYSIDYATGTVTFLNPDDLFGAGGATVTARFEQQDLFAVAPTTILGASATYNLGETGAVNFVTMFQQEATASNRPQLGFEAKANLIAGVNTALHFKPSWLTTALNRLTTTPSTAPSRLDLNGEVAFSRPDPNRSGAAYLEDFETESGTPVSLNERSWEYGSRPQRTDGVEALGFGGSFDLGDAVQLTWQNLVPDAFGRPVQFRPQDIDTSIVLAGSGTQFETVLYMALHADTSGGQVQRDNSSRWSLPPRPGQPRWRSLVTPLSTTGVDLSRDEYLEFWVYQTGVRSADSAGIQLVFDVGSVSEDAVALAPESLTVVNGDSIYTGRQYVGLGRLDTERESTGIFNADVDDNGILSDRPDSIFTPDSVWHLPALCQRRLSGAVAVFPWGDLSSRCTNGNGHLDTEDLDGDNLLDAHGPNDNVWRYVVPLASDKYKVPDRGVKVPDPEGRLAGWTLYRVPLRSSDAISIGTPNLRLAQAVRITVVAPPSPYGFDPIGRFGLARMRFVGAPWVRRSGTPIAGISGSTGTGTGEVVSAIVTTENHELGYTSPPGVFNLTASRNVSQSDLGTQINERSLQIIGRGLEVGQRAEAFLRFGAAPQNLLNYSQLRVWMRGYGQGWERGDLQAYIKVGSDDRNFYLYQAPARTASWEPEMVVDLERWRALRARVEAAWLSGAPPSGAAACGGDPNAYVACDSTGYLVQVADPGSNPPNLAAIQEVAAGILRVKDNGPLPEAQLWVDDVRLTRPVSATGMAVALDAHLTASDVGDVNLSYVRQDGQFRQINQTPTYQTTGTLLAGANWRLDRFLPASFGIAVPVTVSYSSTSVNPVLLSGTDIAGDALADLRRPRSWATTYSLALRRTVRGKSWLARGFLDPLSFTALLTRGATTAQLSSGTNANTNVNANYNLQLGRAGPVLNLEGLLPKFLRGGDLGAALRASRFNLVPTSIRLSSGLTRDRTDLTAFQVPVLRVADSSLVPSRSLSYLWRNSGGLTWQPLGMLTLSGDLASTRDLRNYPDSTPIGRLAGLSRRSFLGMDVGVERDRALNTTFALTPRIASWIRPRLTSTSGFVLSRYLTSRPPVQENGDTTGPFILPQTLNNTRTSEVGASVDYGKLIRNLAGDTSRIGRITVRMRPLDVSDRLTRTSTFDLAAFTPSLGYQLALGGLDRFLQQEGVQALGASDQHTTTVATGADLPLGISTTLSYGNTSVVRFQQVAGAFTQARTATRDWPVGSVRWSNTFRTGWLTLLGATLNFRKRSGTTTVPVGTGPPSVSSVTSSTVAPELQLTFRNGLAARVSYSSLNQETGNNSSTSVVDQSTLTGTFSYAFRMPRSWSRERKFIRSSLVGTSTRSSVCLINTLTTPGDCTTVSDTRTQQVSGRLETDVSKLLTGGLELGYNVNDARHLARKLTTIYATVYFQLTLFAGDYR